MVGVCVDFETARRLLIGSHLVKFLKHAVIKTRFTSQILVADMPIFNVLFVSPVHELFCPKLCNYLCRLGIHNVLVDG
jgi:hypothetical protein